MRNRRAAVLVSLGLLWSGAALAADEGPEPEISELRRRIEDLERSRARAGALERIELGVDTTWTVQGTHGIDEMAPDGDGVEASARVDVSISSEIERLGTVLVEFEAVRGDGVDGGLDPAPGTCFGFNGNAGEHEDLKLSKLSLTMTFGPEDIDFFRGRLDMIVGKLDMADWFDANEVANDENSQFLSGGFTNSLALEFPDGNTAGLVLLWDPLEDGSCTLGLGVAEADGDSDDIFDDLFGIVELGLTWGGERHQHCRLYGWVNDIHHTELADPSKDTQRGYGLGISCDHRVADRLTLFYRWGWQRDDVYEIGHNFSFGFEVPGGLLGREGDAFGVAAGAALLSDDQEDVLRGGGTAPGDERHVEAYWRIMLNERCAISFDVQWGDNFGGDEDAGGIWAFGTRLRLGF